MKYNIKKHDINNLLKESTELTLTQKDADIFGTSVANCIKKKEEKKEKDIANIGDATKDIQAQDRIIASNEEDDKEKENNENNENNQYDFLDFLTDKLETVYVVFTKKDGVKIPLGTKPINTQQSSKKGVTQSGKADAKPKTNNVYNTYDTNGNKIYVTKKEKEKITRESINLFKKIQINEEDNKNNDESKENKEKIYVVPIKVKTNDINGKPLNNEDRIYEIKKDINEFVEKNKQEYFDLREDYIIAHVFSDIDTQDEILEVIVYIDDIKKSSNAIEKNIPFAPIPDELYDRQYEINNIVFGMLTLWKEEIISDIGEEKLTSTEVKSKIVDYNNVVGKIKEKVDELLKKYIIKDTNNNIDGMFINNSENAYNYISSKNIKNESYFNKNLYDKIKALLDNGNKFIENRKKEFNEFIKKEKDENKKNEKMKDLIDNIKELFNKDDDLILSEQDYKNIYYGCKKSINENENEIISSLNTKIMEMKFKNIIEHIKNIILLDTMYVQVPRQNLSKNLREYKSKIIKINKVKETICSIFDIKKKGIENDNKEGIENDNKEGNEVWQKNIERNSYYPSILIRGILNKLVDKTKELSESLSKDAFLNGKNNDDEFYLNKFIELNNGYPDIRDAKKYDEISEQLYSNRKNIKRIQQLLIDRLNELGIYEFQYFPSRIDEESPVRLIFDNGNDSNDAFRKWNVVLSLLFGKKYITTEELLSNEAIQGDFFKNAVKYAYLTTYYNLVKAKEEEAKNKGKKDIKEAKEETDNQITMKYDTEMRSNVNKKWKNAVEEIFKKINSKHITLEDVAKSLTIDVCLWYDLTPQDILNALNENKEFTKEYRAEGWMNKAYINQNNKVMSTIINKGSNTVAYLQSYSVLTIIDTFMESIKKIFKGR